MVAGAQRLVELGPGLREPVSRSEPTPLAQLNQNPISMLSEIPLEEIEQRATELGLHSRINYCLSPPAGVPERRPDLGREPMRACCGRGRLAYFSAEFGMHESLPIYSGGLGVLAGDHIKSASDLGIPLVGIGLFYGQGYFLQRLDLSGWQREEYLETDINNLPMQPAIGANGGRWWLRLRRGALDPCQGLAREGGPLRSAAARFERGRQCSGGSGYHFAPLRRRCPHAHPAGTAIWRRAGIAR